jgi:acyl-CoA thioester hydrolase
MIIERSSRAVPVPTDFRFWTEEKVRNIDTDQFRHVNNAVIASFLEAGRMEIFSTQEAGGSLGSATLAVVRLEIDFLRELFYPANARVGSRVESVGRTSFTVRQGVFNGPDCIASATATCVLFDPNAHKPVPVPSILRDYLLRPA